MTPVRPARPLHPLPEVVVAADAEGARATGDYLADRASAGLLGERSLMEIPFSINAYTARRMRNLQASTMADVLTRDASVRVTSQPGGVIDSFMLRVFGVNEGYISAFAFDGLFGVAPNYSLFPELVERVEILKGPAALLYGMSPDGSVGGVVNILPKRSTVDDFARLTLGMRSAAQRSGHVDASVRFGAVRRSGLRFNGLRRQGPSTLKKNTAQVDAGTLSLDFAGTHVRASIDILSQEQRADAPARPFMLARGVPVPAAPSGRRNLVQPWARWSSSDAGLRLHGEVDIGDHLQLFMDAGGGRNRGNRLSDQVLRIINTQGDTRARILRWQMRADRWSAAAGIRARFDTGPVRHALATQVSYYGDRLATARAAGRDVTSNLHAPVDSPVQAIPASAMVAKVSDSQLRSIAISDTLGLFDGDVQLTLGLRRQDVASREFRAGSDQVKSSYAAHATTPMAGLLFMLSEQLSLYGNLSQGLSKGGTAPAIAANAGEVLPPYRSRQQEVGFKLQTTMMMTTLAAFRVDKPSGQLYGNLYAADSRQRNQGVEFNMSGEPMSGLRLLTGVTWLDARLTRTNNAATLGRRPVGVPSWTANLGMEWDLPARRAWTLTAGLNATGRQFADQANTRSAPGWTTVDIGARYQHVVGGHAVGFNAGISNLFDRRYWSGIASYETLSAGASRTFQVSAAVDF